MLGVAELAKSGRKRKSGRRTPGGELQRARVDYRAMAAQQPHRAWLPADKQLDQKADTPLGALELIGAITEIQSRAGHRFATIVGEYRTTICGPRVTAGSGKGYDCNPTLCSVEPDPSDCECWRRRTRYDGCFEALHDAGRKAMKVVNRVAIHQERCMRGELVALRCGLDALARHLGLTGGAKSVHAGNRN